MADTGWGEPQFEIERVIDEFGVIRMTDEFYRCRRIVCQVIVDRLPFNYYENSNNRQPPNQFYGKLTVFNNGYLREEIPITHAYQEFDLDPDILLLNDAFLSTVCRIIWLGIYLHKVGIALTATNPAAFAALVSLGEFDDWLANLELQGAVPDFPLFPTRRIGFPRFDEVRVKFIEPGVRGKLRLLGWRNMSERMCCSGTLSEPNEPPDEPPAEPPGEEPPVDPDTPDLDMPDPTPPYDGGDDDGRSKPPPETPPVGEECRVYTVVVTSNYFFGTGPQTYQQSDTGFMYGELGQVTIQRQSSDGADNIVMQSRGNQALGQECGDYQFYNITAYTGAQILIKEIVSVTVDGEPYVNWKS